MNKFIDFVYKMLSHEGLTRKEYIGILPQRLATSISRDKNKLGERQHKTITILGHKMYLDNNDAQNLTWNRIYEPFETFVMKSLIKPHDIVLDLGGFIGYYTLIFARAVGRNGKVYVFEPRPSNVTLLKKNLRLNGYPYYCISDNNYQRERSELVIVEQKVVSDKDGKLVLFLSGRENEGMNRIYKSTHINAQNNTIEVDSVTLDKYFELDEYNYSSEANRRIDFIKMDLEGSEFGALKGMKSLIQQPENKNLKIITEFHPPSIIAYGAQPREVIELLRSYDFNIFILDRHTKSKRLIDNNAMSDLIYYASKDTINLLCMRNN